MASKKATIAEKVQDYLERSDWIAAIMEMEKLFAIDQDPLIRVRIGNARRKLNRQGEAIKEYVRAADLFAEKGFVVKALAQYNLALRLDSSNRDVRSKMEKMEMFRTSKMMSRLKGESMEYRPPQPSGRIVPHYSPAENHDQSVPDGLSLNTAGPIDSAVTYDAHVSASFFDVSRNHARSDANIRCSLESMESPSHE